MKIPFLNLKEEAQSEAYVYYDKNVKKLPRNADGKINTESSELWNTDVDAFRHAYVSGVFTQEYSEKVADIFGQLNEFSSLSSSEGERNMDLWNNEIGRKYGKKAKTRKELLDLILKALKAHELIVSPHDSRKFKLGHQYLLDSQKSVVVIEENETGRNELFLDVSSKTILTRAEFVAAINAGQYPGYGVSEIAGILTPVSKSDGIVSNNLG